MRLTLAFASALLLSLALPMAPVHAQSEAAEASAPVDLQRFMGRWYVIGRVPNFIERGHVASLNDYSLRGDGKVSIRYQYREGFNAPQEELNIRASVDQDSGNRRWRTWFYRVIPTHSRVLEVAPDYSWALIGYPGREMAWIFARSPDMDAKLYRELAARLRDHYNVNTDKLKRVPQHPEQVDRLGFEVPNQK
jgi:apolipoprotein D and lipocalin family protein